MQKQLTTTHATRDHDTTVCRYNGGCLHFLLVLSFWSAVMNWLLKNNRKRQNLLRLFRVSSKLELKAEISEFAIVLSINSFVPWLSRCSYRRGSLKLSSRKLRNRDATPRTMKDNVEYQLPTNLAILFKLFILFLSVKTITKLNLGQGERLDKKIQRNQPSCFKFSLLGQPIIVISNYARANPLYS